MAATKVADICARKVLTITENTTVVDIATIMSEKQVHLLPVVKDGKVIGVIGKRDVVKAMARQAE
jgi:CBS domain-containing protein